MEKTNVICIKLYSADATRHVFPPQLQLPLKYQICLKVSALVSQRGDVWLHDKNGWEEKLRPSFVRHFHLAAST